MASLLVNILATSGPYHFLENRPLRIEPPRQVKTSQQREQWRLKWSCSVAAAVAYNFIIHHSTIKWVLPYMRKYHLTQHIIQDSSLNKIWLLYLSPFMTVAVWHFFRMSSHSFLPYVDKAKSKNSQDWLRMEWLQIFHNLNIIKRLCVFLVLCPFMALLQARAGDGSISE